MRCLFSTTLLKDDIEFAESVILGANPIIKRLRNFEIKPPNIKQYYSLIRKPAEKIRYLLDMLECITMRKAIIFTTSEEDQKTIFEKLSEAKFQDIFLHNQNTSLDKFKDFNVNQKSRFVILTDQMSRGYNYRGYDVVVNFDLPKFPQVFLHRIGRVGRFGNTGKAITFISS